MRTLSLLVAVLASAATYAEDEPEYGSGDVRHVDYFGGLRLDIGVAPGVKRSTNSELKTSNGFSLAGDTTTTLSPKRGLAIEGSVFWDTSLEGGFGVAVAPGLFYREVRGTTDNYRITYRSFGFKVGVGPSLTVGKINLELMPYLGLAGDGIQDSLAVPGVGGVKRDSGAGLALSYGVDLTVDYVSNANVLAGLTVGYESFRSRTTLKDVVSPQGVELPGSNAVIKGSGLVLMGTFAFWF